MATNKNVQGMQRTQAVLDTFPEAMAAKVPALTAYNSAEVGAAILNDAALMNCFAPGLLNAILDPNVRSAETRALYSEFTSDMPFGGTYAEVFVDEIEPYDWDACSNEASFQKLFGLDDIPAYGLYFTKNFSKQGKATITTKDIRKAFRDWAGVNDLYDRVINSLYVGLINSENRAASAIFLDAHNNGKAKPVLVNSAFETTNDSGAHILETAALQWNAAQINAAALRMSIAGSREYSWMGVSTMTPTDRLHFFLLPEYASAQNIGVLAVAFHMDQTELMGRIHVVPDFGGAEEDGTIGFMIDREWLKIKLEAGGRVMTGEYNAQKLAINYFLTEEAVMAHIDFYNAVEFTSKIRAIDSVAVTASQSASKAKRANQIAATITPDSDTPDGAYYSKLNWSISGQKSDFTHITPFGALILGSDETASSINVTATSAQDTSKTSTQAVTITA